MKQNPEIRALRQEQGWSQEHLAELLGVDTSTVWRWEHGRAKPKPFVFTAIEQLSQKPRPVQKSMSG